MLYITEQSWSRCGPAHHRALSPRFWSCRWPDELAESQVCSSLSWLQASAFSFPQHEVPREISTFGDLLSQSLIAEWRNNISSPGGVVTSVGVVSLDGDSCFLVIAFVVGGSGAE